MPTQVKGMILDVDGVLEWRGEVCPGAVDTVEALRRKGIVLRFLTNSTLKSRRSCAEGLRRGGFRVLDEEVITASYATAAYLRELSPRSCWVMLEREGLDEFREVPQETDDPEYIVIGDNRSAFDFDHLNKVLRLLLNGAKLIGMQSELVDRSLGEPELHIGSWVGMLERAAGVEAVYVGKPSSYVFELALKTMGLEKSEVLMVGDKVSTDIVGAKAFGIRSVLIRAGEFDERELSAGTEPDWMVDSVAGVLALFGREGSAF
ncbi:MAG: HAD-IIA family hydrolase [Anaerolineae bacterium]|nr:HAD-IIA family hydrolase [Anaerolineae bacterium]